MEQINVQAQIDKVDNQKKDTTNSLPVSPLSVHETIVHYNITDDENAVKYFNAITSSRHVKIGPLMRRCFVSKHA